MSDTDDKEQGVVPIEYVVPDNLITLFSDSIFISHTDAEFYIEFYQTNIPLRLPGMPLPDKITSKCVARIVVTPQHAVRLSEVLQKNLSRFGAKIQALVLADEEGREHSGKPGE